MVVGLEVLSNTGIICTLVFILSIILVNDLGRTDMSLVDKKKYILAIIVRVISISLISYRSFEIKDIINKGLGTNETVIFLATSIQLVVLLTVFRIKPNFKEANCKL